MSKRAKSRGKYGCYLKMEAMLIIWDIQNVPCTIIAVGYVLAHIWDFWHMCLNISYFWPHSLHFLVICSDQNCPDIKPFDFFKSGFRRGETGQQLCRISHKQKEQLNSLTLGNASHMGLCLCSKWLTSGGFLSGHQRAENWTHEKYVKTSNP